MVNADEIAARIGHGTEKHTPEGWRVLCPAHADKNPSLDIRDGREGRTVMICRAGCEQEAVLIAAGLDWTDLFADDPKGPDDEWTPAGRAIARYPYVDEGGKLLFEVVRAEGKRFLQRRPDPLSKSGWTWKLGDVRRPLYRLPEVIDAVSAGRTIFCVEGEKDADAIRKAGAVATCNPHGAGKWRPEHTEALRDADVVVVADRDEPGYKHARGVYKALLGVASRVRLTEPREGKDASDHLLAGYGLEALVVMSTEETQPMMAQDVLDFLEGETEFDWVVEGLLERGDRLILTGFEGLGKSTLIRQLAVCLAAGVHPFKHHAIPSVRVLMVDCENGERLTRRRLRDLIATVEKSVPFERDRLYVLVRPGGLDLTDADDASWLFEQVTAFKPDVTFIGPLYQLHNENPNDEQPARTVSRVLQDVAVRGHCALVTEAHAGKFEAQGGRSVRPIGASLWLRWPEFGYGLLPTSESSTVIFKPWRGPRDEREWPEKLEWSQPWPWRGVYVAPKIETRPIPRSFYEPEERL